MVLSLNKGSNKLSSVFATGCLDSIFKEPAFDEGYRTNTVGRAQLGQTQRWSKSPWRGGHYLPKRKKGNRCLGAKQQSLLQ